MRMAVAEAKWPRGLLAGFLVAKAVGDSRLLRVGWDNLDALTLARQSRGHVLGPPAELVAENGTPSSPTGGGYARSFGPQGARIC